MAKIRTRVFNGDIRLIVLGQLLEEPDNVSWFHALPLNSNLAGSPLVQRKISIVSLSGRIPTNSAIASHYYPAQH
jgi:hypothetical protein